MQNTEGSDWPVALAPGRWFYSVGPWTIRSLVTHNPLYLVSACFVLHGTSQLLPKTIDQSSPYNPWPLLALSIGYVFMLALTAVAIVRFGKVWEDARSILLIIAGMFVELSLALDSPVAQNVAYSRLLPLLGFGVAVLIAEFLIRGLAVRLPWLFRVPLYLMLALVFLYPLLLVRTPGQASILDTSWGIYLFSPATALILLTLLPAIRRRGDYVRDNGSPWSWPWFPWSLFGVLGAAVCLRGYVLSLSFDPVLSIGYADAMGLQTAFGSYFLVPILMAVAVVLLEIGIVEGSLRVQRVALTIPVACIVLSIPAREPSLPYAEFLHQFMGQVTSPVLVSALGALLFYVVSFVRRVPLADCALAVTLLLLSITGPDTVSLETTIAPRPMLLWLLTGFQFWQVLQRRNSKQVFAAIVFGIAAARAWPLAHWHEFAREIVVLHLCVLGILVTGLLFRDWFARVLRRLSAIVLSLACLVVMMVPTEPPPDLPTWAPVAYAFTLIVALLLCAYVSKDVFFLCVGVLSTAVGALSFVWQTYLQLRELSEWLGVRSFLMGFAILSLAATISAVKAGLGQKLAPMWLIVRTAIRSKNGAPPIRRWIRPG